MVVVISMVLRFERLRVLPRLPLPPEVLLKRTEELRLMSSLVPPVLRRNADAAITGKLQTIREMVFSTKAATKTFDPPSRNMKAACTNETIVVMILVEKISVNRRRRATSWRFLMRDNGASIRIRSEKMSVTSWQMTTCFVNLHCGDTASFQWGSGSHTQNN